MSIRSFVTIGDWGGRALPGQHAANVEAVATAMEAAARDAASGFVVNTGDNFYWCGIESAEDSQVETDWVEPYAGYLDEIDWYNVLGNHEYGYNVDAQLNLAEKWILPSRYYSARVELADERFLSFIFLDTSPCVSAYRSNASSGWDPCGDEYPTCSLDSNDDDFEGQCMFHENILAQDCGAQYDWFGRQLDAVPVDDWLIVVGHHPADEIDEEDFARAMQVHGFDLYLNGHVHTLNQYTVDGSGNYVTSGAGAMVDTADQHGDVARAKVRGGNIRSSNNHSYATVFNKQVAGFTLHTFSDDFSTLTTDFYSYTGDVVYSFDVVKQTKTNK